jgi:hypothetical protein
VRARSAASSWGAPSEPLEPFSAGACAEHDALAQDGAGPRGAGRERLQPVVEREVEALVPARRELAQRGELRAEALAPARGAPGVARRQVHGLADELRLEAVQHAHRGLVPLLLDVEHDRRALAPGGDELEVQLREEVLRVDRPGRAFRHAAGDDERQRQHAAQDGVRLEHPLRPSCAGEPSPAAHRTSSVPRAPGAGDR